MVVQKVSRLPRKRLPLTSMVVQKVARLPRKASLRYRKCHACHAKDRGATSVLLRRRASADKYMVAQKVPRLPHKTSPRYRKRHACHAKDGGATSVLLRRRASADIYGGTESTTPATQKTAAPHQSYFVAELPLTSMVAQKVPRLPRKTSPGYRKCHACHAKDRGATSALRRRRASADIYGGTESIHAKRARGTESATPATQKTAAPHQSYFVAELPLTSMAVQEAPRLPRKSSLRRRSAPPATQNTAAPHQSYFVAKLPLTSMAVQKVPRLPRKRPRRHISPTSSPSFR